jgi:hypothetical protein
MDNILNALDRLAVLAAARPEPLPLDAGGVMARIRDLRIEDESPVIPFGFFTGGLAAAAAAAVAVTLVAATAWQQASSPVEVMDSLMDVMDIML